MDIFIDLNTDNDAFQPNVPEEVAEILIALGVHIRETGTLTSMKLKDANGNTCGGVLVNDPMDFGKCQICGGPNH